MRASNINIVRGRLADIVSACRDEERFLARVTDAAEVISDMTAQQRSAALTRFAALDSRLSDAVSAYVAARDATETITE